MAKINGRVYKIRRNGVELNCEVTGTFTLDKAEIDTECKDDDGFHTHLNDGSKRCEISVELRFDTAATAGVNELVDDWLNNTERPYQVFTSETGAGVIAGNANVFNISVPATNNEAVTITATIVFNGQFTYTVN